MEIWVFVGVFEVDRDSRGAGQNKNRIEEQTDKRKTRRSSRRREKKKNKKR